MASLDLLVEKDGAIKCKKHEPVQNDQELYGWKDDEAGWHASFNRATLGASQSRTRLESNSG